MTTSIIVMAFWGLVVYLAVQTAMIFFDNKAIIKWWQDGTTIDKTFNSKFSIWLTLCAGQRSALLYFIISLFLPLDVQMTFAQRIFVSGTLFKFIRYVQDGKQVGIMLPNHLCVTILLCHADNDEMFNKWYDAKPQRRIQSPDDPNDPAFSLTFTSRQIQQNGNTKVTLSTYDAVTIKDSSLFGIYPRAQRDYVEDWKGCIQAWMNGGIDVPDNDRKWAWGPSQNSPNQSILLPITYGDTDADLTHWFAIDKQPDNVFARYGLKPTSPLIQYWINQRASDNGMKVDAAAFENLIYGSPAGGWVGFLTGMGQAASADNFQDECFAQADTQAITPPPPGCSAINKWVGAGTGSALAGAGMLSMLAMPGVDVPILIGFSIFMAATTLVQKSFSSSC